MSNHTVFADWIESANVTRSRVAERLDVTRGIVTRWCNGSRRPNRAMANKIEALTSGAVVSEDWGYVREGASQGAEFLQRYLLQNGRSCATAASDWGVSPTGLRAVVSGRSPPSEQMLQVLSAHVGLALEASDFQKAA